jgi:hypothetical protein
MQTISNSPDLAWQLANGTVSKHLIRDWDFDIEVLKWLDEKKSKAVDKVFLYRIEKNAIVIIYRIIVPISCTI